MTREQSERELRDVTLVFCTCRRLLLFLDTLQSLRRNLPEISGVARVVVIDDNSSAADRLVMQRELPRARFVLKGSSDAGHARSLNVMLDLIETPLVVYWEDDCVLESRGPWLSLARQVLSTAADLVSVSFDPSIENDSRCERRRSWQPQLAPIGLRTHVPERLENYRSPRGFLYERDAWPGFSLKPSMLAVQRLRAVGRFAEHEPDHMEYEFGLRCLERGLRTAILDGPVIRDIGAGSSAYVLNGRPRSYDRASSGEPLRTEHTSTQAAIG